MIQGVLFDMDGLMFDTERIGYEGWKYAGKQLKIEITDSLIASFRGTGTKEKRRLFGAATGRIEDYEEAFSIRAAYADQWIEENGLPIKAGLKKLLAHLRMEGIKTALATSSPREKAMTYLKMAGVEDYFDASVCGTEVQSAKPAPDIFLAAAEALALSPEKCLVLEDSLNGLQAAKAAGCKAVVIPDLSPVPPERMGLWDKKASDLEEVIYILDKIG